MKKVTIHTLRKMKQAGERITMLTAYDATFAKLLDSAGTLRARAGQLPGTPRESV